MDTETHPGGKGLAHCEGNFDVVQYFGALPNPAADEDLPDFPLVDQIRTPLWTVKDDTRLWRVVSTVREVQRVDPANPLTPLAREQIEGQGVNRSLLKIRVSVGQMGFDPRDFLIDAGQSLELWGTSVTVNWVAPATVNAVPGVLPDVAANDMALDGLIGAHVIGIESPLGHRPVLTDYRGAAANAAPVLAIPRGAVDVTIYQSSAGGASTAFTFNYGAPAVGSFELGEVPFIAGQRRSHTTSIVPGATHLVGDSGLQTIRFYTVVWTIQP